MTKFNPIVPTLCVMVGLAGSGKSLLAECRATSAVGQGKIETIESSDAWREKLYGDVNDQTHNAEVFQAMQKSTVEKLKRGENVIYDATNIKMKDRKKILDLVKNIDCHRLCVVVATPVEQCVIQDSERERSVGEHVIHRQLHNFQVPFYEEGWDEIMLLKNKYIEKYDDLYKTMVGFDQQNKWHEFDLYTHSFNATINVMAHRDAKEENIERLLYGVALHDIGKIETQTFTEDGQAHYFNHANVGAYHVLSKLDAREFSDGMSNVVSFLFDVCFYINYHMLPFDWKTEKSTLKYQAIFGEKKFQDLLLINECDKLAQKKEN